MPRITAIGAAGAAAAAALLAGAGIAGAQADGPTTNDDRGTEIVEDLDLPMSSTERMALEADENRVVPLPAASQDADEVTPDDVQDDELDDVEDVEEVDDVEETDDPDETEVDDAGPAAAAGEHGTEVSEVARATEPGPDHGPTVAAVASSRAPARD